MTAREIGYKLNDLIWSLLNELRSLKSFIITAGTFLVMIYLMFLFLENDLILRLFREDGLFEYLSAVILFTTFILFLILFLAKKKLFYLIFCFVFFFGFAEEISWGQRLVAFETPESLKKVNRQAEFTIHNIPLFEGVTKEGVRTTGFLKLFSMHFAWKIFCLIYGALLPFILFFSKSLKKFFQRISFQVPPLILGSFFVLNLIFYFSLKYYLSHHYADLSDDRSLQEASEFLSSFIFFLISFYFVLMEVKGEKSSSLRHE